MTDSGLTSPGEVEVPTLDGGVCAAQPTLARRMTKGRVKVIGSSGGPEPHNAPVQPATFVIGQVAMLMSSYCTTTVSTTIGALCIGENVTIAEP